MERLILGGIEYSMSTNKYHESKRICGCEKYGYNEIGDIEHTLIRAKKLGRYERCDFSFYGFRDGVWIDNFDENYEMTDDVVSYVISKYGKIYIQTNGTYDDYHLWLRQKKIHGDSIDLELTDYDYEKAGRMNAMRAANNSFSNTYGKVCARYKEEYHKSQEEFKLLTK